MDFAASDTTHHPPLGSDTAPIPTTRPEDDPLQAPAAERQEDLVDYQRKAAESEARARELEKRLEMLQRQNEELIHQQALQAERQPSDVPQAEDDQALETKAIEEDSPVDANEALQRLREMQIWRDEEEDSPTTAEAEPPSPTTQPEQPAYEWPPETTADAEHEEGDEALDEYMAQLMERIRGKSSTSEQPSTPQRKPSSQPAAKAEQATPQSGESPSGKSESAEPEKNPREMIKPRQLPPELTSNLAAMRELANSSARNAIDTSKRQQWTRAALGKTWVAICGLGAAGALYYWSPDVRSPGVLAAAVAAVVAVFWGLQSAILMVNVQRAKVAESTAQQSENANPPQVVLSEAFDGE